VSVLRDKAAVADTATTTTRLRPVKEEKSFSPFLLLVPLMKSIHPRARFLHIYEGLIALKRAFNGYKYRQKLLTLNS